MRWAVYHYDRNVVHRPMRYDDHGLDRMRGILCRASHSDIDADEDADACGDANAGRDVDTGGDTNASRDAGIRSNANTSDLHGLCRPVRCDNDNDVRWVMHRQHGGGRR